MIQDNAKKIIRYMIDQCISYGDLCIKFENDYDYIAKELNLDSKNLCRVCFQYLIMHNYVKAERDNENQLLVSLTVKGIDFLEAT